MPLQNIEDSQTPSFEATGSGGYKYSYSPCKPFVKGEKDRSNCRGNVAICRWTRSAYIKIGEVDGLTWGYDSVSRTPELIYKSHDYTEEWYPRVRLICDQSKTSKKDAEFEVDNDLTEWTFTLTHRCACPDGCTGDPTNDPMVDPTDSSAVDGREEIYIPIVALVPTVSVVGLVIWWRRKKRNNYNNDPGNQRLVDQADGGGYEGVENITNPIVGGSPANRQNITQPLPMRSNSCSDITVSKKDNFNSKGSAPV